MKTLFLLAALGLAACGDDDNAQKDAPVVPHPDAPTVDAPPDADCFSGTPSTHEEIINACTTDQYYDKDSHPPLLLDGGQLPPLP